MDSLNYIDLNLFFRYTINAWVKTEGEQMIHGLDNCGFIWKVSLSGGVQ